MDSVLTQLYNTYNNYRARRDAAQAKIDALEELYSVLDGSKFEIELSKTALLSDIAYGYSVFSNSLGPAIGDIQYDCHPDSVATGSTSYSELMNYRNSLDTLMDQINSDLVDLRAEKRANIGLMDDALAAIDEWWTENVTNNNN